MYEIIRKEQLSDAIVMMEVKAERVAKSCLPGQFVIVKIDDKGYYINFLNNINAVGYISFTLEKDYVLIPNKFDITTLKPFDEVLMRSSNAREWTATLYSHYNNNKFYGCGMCCDQCIPYEGNEHLRGTTNDCDNYYKTWK